MLLQGSRRLATLGGEQTGTRLTIKPFQIESDLSALFFIERCLQVPKHEHGMADFPGPSLDIVPRKRCQRPPQVFNGLFIEQDHQPYWTCACHCRFSITPTCIHK